VGAFHINSLTLAKDFSFLKVLIEQWRMEHNQLRPHNALGYQPLVPAVILTII